MNQQPPETARTAPLGGGGHVTESGVDVRELVQEADLGRRKPVGIAARILAATCIGWSLLQLWYASPLPFTFNVFILNDTEMRSLHLGFGLFLAYLAYPFRKPSPRDRIPVQDWIFAAGRRVLRRVPVPVLSRAFDAARAADADRLRHGHRRHAAAARGDAPRRRAAARDHRGADARLRVRRARRCPT